MAEFLSNLSPWHWLVFGLVLMGLEVLVPGAFFLWPGAAALLVGLLLAVFPSMAWSTALILWAVLSVTTLLGWLAYRRRKPTAQPAPTTLNRRGQQYIGRLYTIVTPIVNGEGDMRVDDTIWKIVADEDLSGGTQVRVVAVEGTSLHVEKT